jgi:hypothetical protein
VATVRTKIVAAARWGIANEPRIHYGETRPMPLTRALPLTTDCSGFVTLCYYLAGAPDPNGLGYSGQGWTGTLLRHLPETANPGAGDVVVFGAYPGRHCAIVLRMGDDPLLASHGTERGPVAIRLSAEAAIQRAPATWLSFEAAARAAVDDVSDDDEPDRGGDPAGGDRRVRQEAAADAPGPDRDRERDGAGPGDRIGEAGAAARFADDGDQEEGGGADEAEDRRAEHDDR